MKLTNLPFGYRSKKHINSPNCPFNRKNSRRGLIFEGLEKRELFVVGAFSVPVAIAPGTGFDGVVQLGLPGGGSCSGSLLWTGQHILTAAHCVDLNVDTDGDGTNDQGDGTIDTGAYSVTFNLPGRNVTMNNISAASISVPSAWNGNWNSNDIAIITLPELAPVDAERYGIFRNSNELRQTVTMVGYGVTGTGAPLPGNPAGWRAGSGGVKRSGTNVLDATITNNTVLSMDLDGITGTEAITAPGDSGGPGFLQGQIATITSYGNLQAQVVSGITTYGIGNAFGVTAGHTRVSSYATWIDSVLAQRRDVIIDLQDQPFGNDTNSDAVRIRYNDLNSAVEVTVNGVLYFSELWSRVGKLDIQGSTDNELFALDSTSVMGARLSIDGNSGSNTLEAHGSFYTNNWTIRGVNEGDLMQDSLTTIKFTEIQNLRGGSGADHFKFRPGGKVAETLDGGLGTDQLDYSLLTTTVVVDLQAGSATHVGSGSNGRLSGIENVYGGAGNDSLKGDANNNILRGNAGIDEIFGRGGDDWLYGGTGGDFLYGGTGLDYLFGEGEDDYLDGGRDGVRDQIFGGTGSDTFVDNLVWVPADYKSVTGFWISEDSLNDAGWSVDVRLVNYGYKVLYI